MTLLLSRTLMNVRRRARADISELVKNYLNFNPLLKQNYCTVSEEHYSYETFLFVFVVSFQSFTAPVLIHFYYILINCIFLKNAVFEFHCGFGMKRG